MATEKRAGFTLVEMLVVVSIIGVLAALTMPAIQAAREASMRAKCLSNLAQLSKAAIDFEGVHQRYPGYHESVGGKMVPWTVAILDHIEEGNLYDDWRSSILKGSSPQLVPRVDHFVCPSDPSKSKFSGQAGARLPAYDVFALRTALADPSNRLIMPPLSYVANAGMHLYYPNGNRVLETLLTEGRPDPDGNLTYTIQNKLDASGATIPAKETPRNGVFHDFYSTKTKTTTADMYDGLSSTLLFSENLLASSWIETDIRTLAEVNSGANPRFKQANVFIWHALQTFNPINEKPADASKMLDGTILIPVSPINGRVQIETSSGNFLRDGNKLHPDLTLNPNTARPSSMHPRGVVVAFADGSTRFMREGIEYVVYQQLMTPNGRESDMPEKLHVLKNGQYK